MNLNFTIMKNEKENKQAEEWVTPSINVIGINKDTKLGALGGSDGVFES
jgi:hypothetical protein